MIDEDEQALRDAQALLGAADDVPDPGQAYWAAFPGRVRAQLAPRAPRSEWLSAPRLALAASLALVIAVAALVPRGDAPRDAGGELDDPLLAAFAPAPIDEWASVSGLTTTELEAMEERLFAAETPTAGVAAPVDDAAAPLDEALEGVETLPDDRFDELMKRLDAMNT